MMYAEVKTQHEMKIINFTKKEIKLLTNKQQESYENAKSCYIFLKKFKDNYAKDKKSRKIRDNYTGEYGVAADNICKSKYSIPKEFSIFFHNRSNYDYHKVANRRKY